MDVQEQMYQDVKAWLSSGMKKKDLVKDKQYNMNKFDYWHRKYKAERQSQELREDNNLKKSDAFYYSGNQSAQSMRNRIAWRC